jgi:hypothetical protein
VEDGTDFRLLILYLLLALYDANREDMTFLRLSANDGNLFDQKPLEIVEVRIHGPPRSR